MISREEMDQFCVKKLTEEGVIPDTFKELIIALDCALTGKSYIECLHTYNSVNHSVDKFLEGELYYLSDGGYSRIYWDIWNECGIRISGESRQEVKNAFLKEISLVISLNAFLGIFPKGD